mgnify:CR=1 FL=1
MRAQESTSGYGTNRRLLRHVTCMNICELILMFCEGLRIYQKLIRRFKYRQNVHGFHR